MSKERLGVLLIGAGGAVASTVIAGVAMMKKGTERYGMITEAPLGASLGVVDLDASGALTGLVEFLLRLAAATAQPVEAGGGQGVVAVGVGGEHGAQRGRAPVTPRLWSNSGHAGSERRETAHIWRTPRPYGRVGPQHDRPTHFRRKGAGNAGTTGNRAHAHAPSSNAAAIPRVRGAGARTPHGDRWRDRGRPEGGTGTVCPHLSAVQPVAPGRRRACPAT